MSCRSSMGNLAGRIRYMIVHVFAAGDPIQSDAGGQLAQPLQWSGETQSQAVSRGPRPRLILVESSKATAKAGDQVP